MNDKNKIDSHKLTLHPNKHILLWCSPGFGLVDMWLPIIRKLKKKGGVKIDFIFPEPSSLRLEEKNSDLFNLAEQFSDNTIYRGYSGRWFIAETLVDAKAGIKFSKFDEKIMRLSSRLTRGVVSKYFFLRLIGRYISIILKYIITTKENFSHYAFYDFSSSNNIDAILCDITVEEKHVNKELRNEFKNVQKFSVFHGLSATWVEPYFNCEKTVSKRSNVTVYSVSNLETDGYKKCFGILDKNIVHAGIPRHDNDWIKFIFNQVNRTEEEVFDSFVFIIGRPASPYNAAKRKKAALKDIHNKICIENKLKLIVKTHPKESLDGVDGKIYEDALGLENYGKTWVYSNTHPFVLGSKAIFAVSFYSGVSIDMLAFNKPTIEYLNLEGLESYDNESSLRNKRGAPVFQYRYADLVLGASSTAEFYKHVDSLLNQYNETISPLFLNYNKYFETFSSSSSMVANDIFKKI